MFVGHHAKSKFVRCEGVSAPSFEEAIYAEVNLNVKREERPTYR